MICADNTVVRVTHNGKRATLLQDVGHPKPWWDVPAYLDVAFEVRIALHTKDTLYVDCFHGRDRRAAPIVHMVLPWHLFRANVDYVASVCLERMHVYACVLVIYSRRRHVPRHALAKHAHVCERRLLQSALKVGRCRAAPLFGPVLIEER